MQIDIKTTNSKEFVKNVKLLERTLVCTTQAKSQDAILLECYVNCLKIAVKDTLCFIEQ